MTGLDEVFNREGKVQEDTINRMSKSTESKFARMQHIIQSEAFLSQRDYKQVPFFIFAYEPAEEIAVKHKPSIW